MLNFLHISDFRIDAPQAFMLPDAAERRKQDLMNCFINFCEKVCEIKPDAIFISGNLIDSPDSHPAVILEIADILNNISLSSKIHIFMVTGSRDTPIGRPNKEKFLSTFSRNPFIHVFSNSQNFSSITVKSKNHIQFTVYGKSYESPPKNITSKIPIHNNIVDPAILLVPAIPRKIKETKFYKNLSNLDPDICLKNNFSFLALGGLENRFFSNSEEMSWCIPGSPERITLSGDGGLGSIIKVTLTPTHKKWNVSFHEIKINTIKTVNIIINMDLSVFSIEEKIKEYTKNILNSKENIIHLTLSGNVTFNVYKKYNRKKVISELLNKFHNVILINNLNIIDTEKEQFKNSIFYPDPQKIFSDLIKEKINNAEKENRQDYKNILIRSLELGSDIISKNINFNNQEIN